jgi:hypothetical protein
MGSAERMGQEIYKQGLRPDVVLCSGAMRALETALYAFGPTAPGGGTVYPIPCVSESRAPLVALRNALPFHILHDDDNRLTPTPELQLRLAETHPESRLPVGVNWKYLEECGNDAGPSLSSFYRHLLPVIVSDVIAGRVHSDVFKPLQPFPDKDEVGGRVRLHATSRIPCRPVGVSASGEGNTWSVSADSKRPAVRARDEI